MYETEEIVVVTNNYSKHGFAIGQEVKLIKDSSFSSGRAWLCYDNGRFYYLQEQEFKRKGAFIYADH